MASSYGFEDNIIINHEMYSKSYSFLHSCHLCSIVLQPKSTIIIPDTPAARQGPAAGVTPVLIPSQPSSSSLFVLVHCLCYFDLTTFLKSASSMAYLHRRATS